MQALDDTGLPKSQSVHTLLLGGIFLGGVKVLSRCRMTFNATAGVQFELAIRSQDINVSQIVLAAIA